MIQGELKTAERIARELERRIFAASWEAGHFLGREDEIARDFGASRAILREAIAIAELEGLVECRRGQRGGLFVGSPAGDTRTSMMRNYLVLASATPEQVRTRRAWLDRLLCAAMSENLDPRDCGAVRALFRMPEDRSPPSLVAHNALMLDKMVEMAGIPALSLFATAVVQSNIELIVWNGAKNTDVALLADRAGGLRCDLMEAIIAADARGVDQVQVEINKVYEAVSSQFQDPPRDVETAVERLSLLWKNFPLHASRRAKKPQAVARLIASELGRDGASGRKVGSEQDLMLQFGVSGGVVREAVRTLEHYGMVRSRRGNDGGIFRQERDPRAIAGVIGRHLAPVYAAAPMDLQIITVQTGLAAAATAAGRAVAAPLGALVPADPADLLRWLAGAADDPALEIMAHANLAAAPSPPGAGPGFPERRQGLLDAVEAGDAALSRRWFIELANRDLFPGAPPPLPALAHGFCVGG